jgi:hypothetical protein
MLFPPSYPLMLDFNAPGKTSVLLRGLYRLCLHHQGEFTPGSFTTSRRRTGGSPRHQVRHNMGAYNPRNQILLVGAYWA